MPGDAAKGAGFQRAYTQGDVAKGRGSRELICQGGAAKGFQGA